MIGKIRPERVRAWAGVAAGMYVRLPHPTRIAKAQRGLGHVSESQAKKIRYAADCSRIRIVFLQLSMIHA